jgi:hypothetical protein
MGPEKRHREKMPGRKWKEKKGTVRNGLRSLILVSFLRSVFWYLQKAHFRLPWSGV